MLQVRISQISHGQLNRTLAAIDDVGGRVKDVRFYGNRTNAIILYDPRGRYPLDNKITERYEELMHYEENPSAEPPQ